jgi:hypothetical protein
MTYTWLLHGTAVESPHRLHNENLIVREGTAWLRKLQHLHNKQAYMCQ